jgi:hypothetical protein
MAHFLSDVIDALTRGCGHFAGDKFLGTVSGRDGLGTMAFVHGIFFSRVFAAAERSATNYPRVSRSPK